MSMVIEQTVEIPASRQLVLDLPREIPTGRAKAAIVLTFVPEQDESSKRAAAMEKLFGCCSNAGDSLDSYMKRHWAENDLERAMESRRKPERG
jgi:hypothetical protein